MPAKHKKLTIEAARQKFHDNITYERAVAGVIGFLAIGATFYHFVEKLPWVDAIYFTAITLTTVGYGDISPKTNFGKMFTVFYLLVGLTLFVVLARVVLNETLLRAIKRRQK